MRLLPTISLLAAALTALPAMAADAPRRTIMVTGEGFVDATPDMARVTLGVVTQAPTAGAALAGNSAGAAGLIEAVKALGIEARDIATASVSLDPVYRYPEPNEQPPPPPAITGYTATNTLVVRIRAIDRLGALLDKAVTAGANTIGGIGFTVAEPEAKLDEARKAAVADARRKAELYATAAGARLGKVIELSEAGVAAPMPVRAMRMAAADAAPVPIEAGETRLSVSISVTYELAD